MRISDWSSDVCSSDLIGCTETMARRKALPGRIGAAKLLVRSVAILGLRTAGLAALLLPGARRVDIAGQWVKSWGRCPPDARSEEHTSELQSLMRISYAVFCLKKKNNTNKHRAERHKNNAITTQTNTNQATT